MYRFKRLLVHLHLTERDAAIIRYSAMIARMAQAESVHFVHVNPNLDIPPAALKAYPELLDELDTYARKRLSEAVALHWDGPSDAAIHSDVIQGNPLEVLLRLARSEETDLVVVDRVPGQRPAEVLAEKLARKAPCSVLALPDGADSRISRILVGVDFSAHSAYAVEIAAAFAAALRLPRITGLHAYRVPTGFYKSGKSHDEFAGIMAANARAAFAEFIRPVDTQGVECHGRYVLAEKGVADVIAAAIQTEGVDLVVMGTRGRSDSAAVLLGSVTEALLSLTGVPVLAVKEKGSGLGLLEVILK